MTITNYKDLEVWQKAMELVVACYKITESFPKKETLVFPANYRERLFQ